MGVRTLLRENCLCRLYGLYGSCKVIFLVTVLRALRARNTVTLHDYPNYFSLSSSLGLN